MNQISPAFPKLAPLNDNSDNLIIVDLCHKRFVEI